MGWIEVILIVLMIVVLIFMIIAPIIYIFSDVEVPEYVVISLPNGEIVEGVASKVVKISDSSVWVYMADGKEYQVHPMNIVISGLKDK